MILIEFLLVVLLADFASGFVHWLEDSYGTEDTPILGSWIVRPNVLHHHDSRAFLAQGWWASNWDLYAASALTVLVAWLIGALSWHVLLFALLSAHANQVHKWSHMVRNEAPLPVRVLQRAHVLTSFTHHAGHHRGAKNERYCVLTEVLNPILDRARFWRGLEALCLSAAQLQRRAERGT